MAVTAFVVGVIGLFISLVPFFGLVAIPLGILAMLFGAVAVHAPRRSFAIAGLACGLVGGVVGVYRYAQTKDPVVAGQTAIEVQRDGP